MRDDDDVRIVADGPGEILHLGERSRVTRRQVGAGAGTVIWKEPLGPDAPARLQHERQMLERLAGIAGVPRLAGTPYPDGVLALRDTGGVPLAERLRSGRLTIDEQVDIALGLARTLAAIHRTGVTHGDVNAANVLLDSAGGEPVLIDFGQASTVAERQPGFSHHNEIEGTLATLAPEQTGRTGRFVDQRADLYGLGATLYQMATGQPPFADNDPLRLVHDILARVPVPPAERDPAVPPALSAIIMRLLEKEPDQRYQSADGLAYDLRRLCERLAAGRAGGSRQTGDAGQIGGSRQTGDADGNAAFPLGEHDFPLRLSAPGRLVGRQAEIAALEQALDGTIRGTCRGVLVSGAPGVGKTVLVNELRPMVTARSGWFVAGKFDQYRRDLGADGSSLAIRALGRLLLTESDADLLRQRARLTEALGGNVSLIASLLPEIALVLGVSPEPVTGEASQLQERLIRATLDVLRVVASAEHPVVLVLDDLQWATGTAINLIDALIQGDGQPGLLVIGAFRPGEVDVAHPLSAMLTRWQRLSDPPVTLRPENLPAPDLSVLLAEMLRLHPDATRPLATVIGERTGGNPFDTVALVNALREDGALVRDDDGWHWDVATVRRHVGSGDVLDLLAARIGRLPERTGTLLRRMACLGGEVDTGLLRVAAGNSPAGLDDDLAPALEDGLLVMGRSGHDEAAVVRFRHDRVQQAAIGRLDPAVLRALRLDLARQLAGRPEYAGLAAEQYLPVTEAISDPAEQRRVVSLYHAAARALRLVNPAMAERFLAAALGLLDGVEPAAGDGVGPAARGTRDRRLRVELETAHHAALYHLGRLAEVDERYRSVERCCADPLELTDAACTQISSLTLRERPVEAVTLGLDLLRRLGVGVPADEQVGPWTEAGLRRFQGWVEHDGLAEDLVRAEATDPTAIAAARLINRMIPPAYFAGMPVMPWLMLECQRLWAEHGPCAALVGPLSHAGFVSIMLGQEYREIMRDGEYRAGYAAIQRALAVSEAHGYEAESAQSRILLALSGAQWFEPLEAVLAHARRALEGLIRAGDQQNAGFSGYALVPDGLECTPTLEEYLAEVEATLAFSARTGNDQAASSFLGYRQLARALRGETAEPGVLSDASFDARAHLAEQQAGNVVAAAYTNIAYALAGVLSGDLATAGRHVSAALELTAVYQSTLSMAVAYLLRAVCLADALRSGPGPADVPGPGSADVPGEAADERAALVEELDRCREWLARRATDAPVNFEHLLHLVDAERAWALGDPRGAAGAYDAALHGVRKRQRPWHAALIAERAAGFHFAHGMPYAGQHLLTEARDRYRAWGAAGKVRALEASHPFLRTAEYRADAGASPAPAVSAATVSAEAIDLMAILRACQALSSETSLERLHTRVREVLSAVTGATGVRVVLWRDEPKGWYLPAAEEPAAEQAGSRGAGTPLDEATGAHLVPLSAFRYAERTQEPLLVADVAGDDRFSADPYLRARRCRSLLVVPILSHGAPQAMLILEHNLSSGAFTADRLDAVRLLAGQLAVSLENAIVYGELEERVRQRTRELRATQGELVATARRVGMAEIATNVLHNVGNVLNSVNVSASLAVGRIRASKVDGLTRSVDLLREHEADLAAFLTRDERGRLLPGYLAKVAEALGAEHRDVLAELAQLTRNIDHIKDIVATQQTYAGSTSLSEPIDVGSLVDDAIRVNAEALKRHRVQVVRQYSATPTVLLDKVRVMLILVNLISNAKNAMADVDDGARRLSLGAEVVDGYSGRERPELGRTLRIHVIDSGEGIRPEHLTQIFAHGFTTRDGGHGFGLHSCALAAREMGGTLTAHSDGPGHGATFTLELPVTLEGTG